jgi:hypothetical protein
LLKKIGWGSLIVPLPFMLFLYFVQIQPYLAKFRDLPPVKPEIFQNFSASFASIYKCSSQYSFWYGQGNCPYDGVAEYAYFPGFLLLGSAFLFFLFFFISLFPRLRKTKTYARILQSDPDMDRVFPWFMLVLFFAVWFLSLGPYLYILNIPSHLYLLLLKIIPGMGNIRTPGRFGILLGLPLSVFLVLLLRRIRWGANVQRVALIAMFLAVGIETLPDHRLFPITLDPGGLYSLTAQYVPADTPLLELPVWNKKHSNLIINIQKQLVGSTYHWSRLMVGYGASSTPGFWKLANLDLQIQKGSNISDLIRYAEEVQISHYLVHLPDYPAEVQTQWRQLANAPSSCQFFEQDGYLLFEINSDNCPD